METAEQSPRSTAPEAGRIHPNVSAFDWGAIATGVLSALLVVYLALENGGYDPIPRDQVGVAVWWLLLLGVAVQALPVKGGTRAALLALGLLCGFAVWTALAFAWTESAERTATELARVVTYLGVFALGISLVTRRQAGARHVLNGVTFGLALVAALGVLSRLQMEWFPSNELETIFPEIEIARRLSYPLNYSSAMGALAGMTLPLLLATTAFARTIAAQALAAAAIPIAGLALYLATSGTGAAVALVAMLAFLALAPDRLPKLLTLAAGAGGTAVLATAVAHRPAVARGLPTSTAEHQGNELVWIALAVCAGVALAQIGLAFALKRWSRPRWLQISSRQALVATSVAIVIAVPATIAAGAPQELSHRWEVFKSRERAPGEPSAPSTAIDFKGNGRYQFWVSAVDANKTAPWTGIGPGTFEFWWAQHGSYGGFVRNAHSLYMETLAELGIVGFVLIGGFVLTVLVAGAVRSLRAPPSQRLILAASTAGAAGFAMAATLDWVWQLATLPLAFMLLAAVALSGFGSGEPTVQRWRQHQLHNRLQRAGVIAISVVALVAIWFPLRGAIALQQSQINAARGDSATALREANVAADAQPYTGSPLMQEALILERLGRLRAATAAASAATRKESANWRTWLILSRIQAERNHSEEAIRAYRQARALAPKFQLLSN